MSLTYIPDRDEIFLKISPAKRKPSREIGRFRIWWDDEGNIRALSIKNYTEEEDEFRRNLNIIRLGGIWKGIRIEGEDIKEAREELLRKIEGKW